jgi:sialate O-acetylesterase
MSLTNWRASTDDASSLQGGCELIRRYLWLFLTMLCVLPVAHAEVSLPVLFSDGMLVQRDLPIHVWGRSAAAEKVSVTFRGETRSAVADELGRWQLYLPPVAAGGPYDLAVSGSNQIVIHNILVGDVWVASGQSNMEFKMRQLDNPQAEIAAAKFPRIRIMRIKHGYSDYPLTDAVAEQRWAEVSPQSVPDFSAVAYYFAREIHQKEKVPVGIIESDWGGTVAEAWTSMDALASDAALMPVFASRAHSMDAEAENLLLDPIHQAQIDKARAAGLPWPKVPWHPLEQMWAPAQLYNAMIAPLTPYAIRGVIWYQGESNSKLNRAPSYERLFETLIRDWHNQWALGDFPFLYVQISNFTSDATEDWATIREAQLRTLQLRNTGMAVTIDVGNPDDVHPRDKVDVGHRLALAARATVYGEPIEYSGPLVRQVTREDHSLRVWFDHAAGLQSKGGPPTSFEIAGADGKFVPADAHIDGQTMLVSSVSVAAPVKVRYGWANSPNCNLFNGEGLPASPFQQAAK